MDSGYGFGTLTLKPLSGCQSKKFDALPLTAAAMRHTSPTQLLALIHGEC
jgi:hypothetical protein